MTSVAKDVKPFTYTDVGAQIPNYTQVQNGERKINRSP